MNPLALISLLLGIVEPALAASGVIPAGYQGIAAGVVAAINALKTELTGATGQISVTAASLAAGIAAGLQSLAQAGALPSAWGGVATALAHAAAAGIDSGTQAAAGPVNPDTLQPIAPVA